MQQLAVIFTRIRRRKKPVNVLRRTRLCPLITRPYSPFGTSSGITFTLPFGRNTESSSAFGFMEALAFLYHKGKNGFKRIGVYLRVGI